MHGRHAWLFQSRGPYEPLVDINQEALAGRRILWKVTRYAREMSDGDLVLFWEAGRYGGFKGWGTIDGYPGFEAGKSRQAAIRVAKWFKQAITTEPSLFMDSDNVFLRFRRGTNFRIQPWEVERLTAEMALPPDLVVFLLPHEQRPMKPKERRDGLQGPSEPKEHSALDIARSGHAEEVQYSFLIEHARAHLSPTTPPDPRKVPLWFATNREPVPSGFPPYYLGVRSNDEAVHYGRCLVNVPDGHRFGSTGSGLLTRLLRGDDRLSIDKVDPLPATDFWQQLHASFRGDPTAGGFALLFVHGYRVSFEDAAIRTAQLAYDLKAKNAAFFSWPSAGSAPQYTVDEASAVYSVDTLMHYLTDLDGVAALTQTPLNLIAHSMGCRVLLSALQHLTASGWRPQALDKIIFAAPDEDSGTFKKIIRRLAALGKGKTLYASSKDKPVSFSAAVHGYSRAGYLPPVTVVEGLDTIDASAIDATFLGHSDFATERPLLNDIFVWLHNGTAPSLRPGIQPAHDPAGLYWQLT